MNFDSLRDFIEEVEKSGECRVIEGAEWDLEIGYITDLGRETADGPLILFDKIKGYPPGYRVVSNMYDTRRRTALGLGYHISHLKLRLFLLVVPLCMSCA